MCGSSSRCTSTLVRTSSAMTRTAAVQNTRPYEEDRGSDMRSRRGKHPAPTGAEADRSLEVSRLPRYRGRGHRRHVARRIAVLLPQYPRQQERAEAHRHVGDVERGPPRDVADADVDEVDDAE